MAHNRFSPERREEIAQAIRDKPEGMSASALAKQLGCSKTSVTTIAREIGLEDTFNRAQTAAAAAAKQVDNRARRAALIEAYLNDAEQIRERIHETAEFVTVTGEVIYLTRPGARDVRDFVVAGTSLLKASMDVEKHDTQDDTAATAVDAWLRSVMGRS